MTGRAAPGWYPDYEAPPGHQRYWDGEQWTERRPPQPARPPVPRIAAWVAAGVVAVVVVALTVLVLTHDDPAPSGSPPPSAGTPGSPEVSSQTESASPTSDGAPVPGTGEVETVLDDGTLRLVDGSQVVLVGVTVGQCGVAPLGQLVEGRQVSLAQPGADTDSLGRLLRYVERDGLDVGLRLLQRGLATASDEANPRRAIYRRVDARSPDLC